MDLVYLLGMDRSRKETEILCRTQDYLAQIYECRIKLMSPHYYLRKYSFIK